MIDWSALDLLMIVWWLIDWLIYWYIDSWLMKELIDWWLVVSLSFLPCGKLFLIRLLYDWLINELIDECVDWSMSWLIDDWLSVCCSCHEGSSSWYVWFMIDWLLGWLMNELIDWSLVVSLSFLPCGQFIPIRLIYNWLMNELIDEWVEWCMIGFQFVVLSVRTVPGVLLQYRDPPRLQTRR